MRRSLVHFRRLHVAVLLSAAVATSALTGALLVGDSMRGSLRDLTQARLGAIDYALVAGRFFREQLAADLAGQPEFASHFTAAAPAILQRGTAAHATTGSRASRVQIAGVDQRFAGLFPAADGLTAAALQKQPGHVFPPVVINQSLQRELRAAIGDPILLTLPRQDPVHRESVFGRRSSGDILQTLRLELAAVLPDRGAGRFGLHPHQSLPLNAYVSLKTLQRALGQGPRANAVFVSSRGPGPGEARVGAGAQPGPAVRSAEAAPVPRAATAPPPLDPTQTLADLTRRIWRLEDLGLELSGHGEWAVLESSHYILSARTVELATAVAAEIEAPAMPVLTYLANRLEAGGRLAPYVTVAALDPPASDRGEPAGWLRLGSGEPAPALAEDEILLSEWAARDLAVEEGVWIDLSYYAVGPREQLSTESIRLRLRGVVAMEGLGADPELTPDFPGLHDAEHMSSWTPPFPLDLGLIRPRDEAYWDEFRAAPRAFVAARTGQRLWRNRFGTATSVWLGPARPADMGETKARFERALLESTRPEEVGLAFRAVKAQGLSAAAGATDFSGLFTGFSLFLIASSALLVGLLFRLGVEQRGAEMGVLLAAGYSLGAVRGRFLREGGALAAVGAAVGLGGSVLYAWLMVAGLRTWWRAAVGTPFLSFHLSFPSLALGYIIALVVVLLTIAWTVRQAARVPVRALLAGATVCREGTTRRRSGRLAWGSLGMAGALVFAGLFASGTAAVGLFFGSGALLLVGGLAGFSAWLRRPSRHRARPLRAGRTPRLRLGVRNSARAPGRSMLCAGLVACACFVIVAVGASRKDATLGTPDLPRASGTGGFALVAQSEIPLHQDLNAPEGRFELGFAGSDTLVADARFHAFRVLPGEDVSCLNLYLPQQPRILGVPDELIERGGFQFQEVSDAAGAPGDATSPTGPWRLLQQPLEPGVIPAFGDFNSVRWILHRALGDDVVVQDDRGQELRLRLMGLLRGSLFQGELLVSAADFERHFPAQSGYGYFLIEAPAAVAPRLAARLEAVLGSFGFDATSAAAKLMAYHAVENTYLATFQSLGGLGLLLGTLGLGVVLVRNAAERRGELATLQACGFRRSALAAMLVAENGFVLVVGISLGSLAALLALAPHLWVHGASVPWQSLLFTLFLVLLTGAVASVAAVRLALRGDLVESLKAL